MTLPKIKQKLSHLYICNSNPDVRMKGKLVIIIGCKAQNHDPSNNQCLCPIMYKQVVIREDHKYYDGTPYYELFEKGRKFIATKEEILDKKQKQVRMNISLV